MPRNLMKLLAAATFTALPVQAQDNQQADQSQSATAKFVDQSGANIGAAVLTGAPGGVLITVEVNGVVPESWVAFHIHETGECDPTLRHESAGGHFNPSNSEHGYFRAGGPHAGDMPNLWVDSGGSINAQTFNPYVVLSEGENQIMGRALMIHKSVDDYETSSSGGVGERLACAVIE